MKAKSKCRLMLLGAILLIVAIIFLLTSLLKGETTISGNFPEDTRDDSIGCVATGLSYPFFRYDESLEKSIEINILFNGANFKSISLIHTLSYGNEVGAKTSEAQNHAAMNISFGDNGLGGDSFSANYNINQNKMTMSIYATLSDLQTQHGGRYFFIDDLPFDSSVEQYKNHLEKQGFACKISN